MAARRTLSALMIVLGAAAMAIGLSIYVFGAAWTAEAAMSLWDRALGRGPAAAAAAAFGPIFESELRFYAPFWVVYGAVLISTARDLPAKLHRIPALSALFFAGGVGRALAWMQAGAPHPAFIALMVIELVLPLIFIACWAIIRRV